MASKEHILIGDYCLVPLKNGGFAIIDSKHSELVKKFSWKWSPHKKCVGCFDGKTSIYLHNVVCRYSRVTFKNGNKCDCRSENLLDWCNADINKTRHGKFYSNRIVGLSDRRNKIFVYRMVKRGGEEYVFSTSISYGTLKYGHQIRTKEEALSKAKILHSNIFSMSKDEFIKWTLSTDDKKIRMTKKVAIRDFDALLGWDQYGGKEVGVAEMFQSGISHIYQSKD